MNTSAQCMLNTRVLQRVTRRRAKAHDILRQLIVLLLLLYLELLKLPFSLFYLPLQFIHLLDEVSGTFLFSNKLFPKHSLHRCLCSGGACLDTNILQKRLQPLFQEEALPWQRQRTLQTTSTLVIGCYPSATGSTCIVFIASYEI